MTIFRTARYGLLALAACTFALPAIAADVRVADSAALQRAVSAARDGDTIMLAPGHYSAATLRGRSFTKPLVITSESTSQPATFASLQLDAMAGVTLRNLAFDGRGAIINYELQIGNSRRIQAEALSFDDPTRGRTIQAAAMIRLSSDVALRTSYFTRVWHGISHLNSNNVELSRNEFDGIQTDAMRGGGTSNLTIKENVCNGFKPVVGDHPDCIQLWSTGQKLAATNIMIRDNLMVRGRGGYPIQGVFVRDTLLKLPFQQVTIQGNLAIGLQYNAVSFNGVRASRVQGNQVIAYSDIKSFVILRNTVGVTMQDNSSSIYILLNNRQLTNIRNRVIPIDDLGERRILAWLDARPAMRDAAGPLLRRLIAEAKAS